MNAHGRSLRALAALALFLVLAPAAARAGEGNTADYHGVPVAYADSGRGAPAVVLIHGWACDRTDWRMQVPDLEQSHRVIAIDLPGHGQSGLAEGDCTQESFAEAVIAVMDQAGIDRAVLVGHSMGAIVGRQAALMHPERVAGLIIVDGALMEMPEAPAAREEFLTQFKTLSADLSGPDSEQTIRWFAGNLYSASTPEWLKEEVVLDFMNTPRATAACAMASLSDPRVWARDPVATPTLAVYATSPDTPENLESYLRELFPNLDYRVWDGPGHFIMLEEPDRLNAVMLEFLNTLP